MALSCMFPFSVLLHQSMTSRSLPDHCVVSASATMSPGSRPSRTTIWFTDALPNFTGTRSATLLARRARGIPWWSNRTARRPGGRRSARSSASRSRSCRPPTGRRAPGSAALRRSRPRPHRARGDGRIHAHDAAAHEAVAHVDGGGKARREVAGIEFGDAQLGVQRARLRDARDVDARRELLAFLHRHALHDAGDAGAHLTANRRRGGSLPARARAGAGAPGAPASCAPTAASSAARRCSSILARSPSWPAGSSSANTAAPTRRPAANARSSATACRRADSAFARASASEERRSRRWLSSSSRAAANSARAAATSSAAASAARSTSGFESWTMTVSGSTVSPARTSTRSTRASTRVESQRASRGCRMPGPRTLRSSVPSFTSSR